ncbi:hypothetical protein BDZ89DRAFT_940721 [Hymenopellis radicata]|nr:hypothetical protein BDZ89DRAFT_940721 [Hymenopellis radicata]
MANNQGEADSTFFDRERDRLAREITAGFEDLLSSTNGLNRKLEEVLGMTKEYDTIAALWSSFANLMKQQPEPDAPMTDKACLELVVTSSGQPMIRKNHKYRKRH